MRVTQGWIVEVDGGTGPDAFARRVLWAAAHPAGVPRRRFRCTNDAGGRGATYFASEQIPSPEEIAGIPWGWLHGRLPDGYELRAVEYGLE